MKRPGLSSTKSTGRRILVALSILNGLNCVCIAQTKPSSATANLEAELQIVLSEIHDLDIQASNLNSSLARARAQAEIADALWSEDEKDAKEILTHAYKLTFPESSNITGDTPKKRSAFPTTIDLARREVRRRILQVAARDKTFANSLIKLQVDGSDKIQTHIDNATLAKQALDAGDYETARAKIIDALNADPTQTMAGLILKEYAAKDRAAADKLIIQYLDILRGVPIFSSDDWARVYFVMLQLVFPALIGDQKLPPPGPAVMREYAIYMVESLGGLEQNSPGSMRRLRNVLLTAWSPVKQYAPELAPAFMRLESLSRSNGDTSPIPTMEEVASSSDAARERSLARSLENGTPDAPLIEAAARRGEFDKARKAIDRLEDGDAKRRLLELIDAREAVALASNGHMPDAERLALRLHDATRIIEAYASLIANSKANNAQKVSLGYRALNQLRGSSNVPPTPLNSLPAVFAPTSREVDPRLSALSRLLLNVVSFDDDLAQAVLAETILTANHTDVDSSQGRLGFDANLFKEAMSKNQVLTEQAATSLTDPLRRIVALAVINKWKVDKLQRDRHENGVRTATATPPQH